MKKQAALFVIVLGVTVLFGGGCSDKKKGDDPEKQDGAGTDTGNESSDGTTTESDSESGTSTEPADPCDGVVCDSPPANTCSEGGDLIVQDPTGLCYDGACQYGFSIESCTTGICEDGVCVDNPCQGVSCNTPPVSECVDDDTVRGYNDYGECSVVDGEAQCDYASVDMTCVYGCGEGACLGEICAGVACDTPPDDYCEDAGTLIVYERYGICLEDETCRYNSAQRQCANGCENAACIGETATDTVASTDTESPTDTAVSTDTAVPSDTAMPTDTWPMDTDTEYTVVPIVDPYGYGWFEDTLNDMGFQGQMYAWAGVESSISPEYGSTCFQGYVGPTPTGDVDAGIVDAGVDTDTDSGPVVTPGAVVAMALCLMGADDLFPEDNYILAECPLTTALADDFAGLRFRMAGQYDDSIPIQVVFLERGKEADEYAYVEVSGKGDHTALLSEAQDFDGPLYDPVNRDNIVGFWIRLVPQDGVTHNFTFCISNLRALAHKE